jgi:tRNA (guanine37-N1)-methyltransferase
MSVSGLYRPDGQPMENGLVIHPLTMEQHAAVRVSYELLEDAGEDDEYGSSYVCERIEKGCMFGAFVNDAFAGYIGIHDDGSIGMLHVFEEYRGQKLGKALQTYAINQALEWGWIPYGQVVEGNEVSMKLQDSLGLHMSKSPVVWLW